MKERARFVGKYMTKSLKKDNSNGKEIMSKMGR